MDVLLLWSEMAVVLRGAKDNAMSMTNVENNSKSALHEFSDICLT